MHRSLAFEVEAVMVAKSIFVWLAIALVAVIRLAAAESDLTAASVSFTLAGLAAAEAVDLPIVKQYIVAVADRIVA